MKVLTAIHDNPNTPSEIRNKYAWVKNYNIKLKVCSDPHTSSEMLEQIAKTCRKNSKKALLAIANNPNTPSHILEDITNSLSEEDI